MKWARIIAVIALLEAFICCPAWAALSQSFTWDPSPSPNVAGYVLYYGNTRGSFDHRLDVGLRNSATVSELVGGRRYFFAVSAYDATHLESNPSNELSFVAPMPLVLKIGFTAPNRIKLSWNAVPGQTYQVQYCTNLQHSSWTIFRVPIKATGSTAYLTEIVAGSQRFYRVQPSP